MPYALFHYKFPDVAIKETRSFTSFDKPELAGDEFGLLEMYCDEPGCDCRRVMFCVMSQLRSKPVAYIGYGWEDEKFYMKRFRFIDRDDVQELQGPSLNLMSPQSNLAPAILEVVAEILEDRLYVERLKRHYNMFRATIEKETGKLRKRSNQTKKPKHKKHRR